MSTLKLAQAMTMHNIIIYLIVLIFLPACIGPRHTIPEHTMPKSFTQTSSTSTAEPLLEWWKQFENPMLNKLIKLAITHNYNLQLARERIEEARALYHIKSANLFPEAAMVGDIARNKNHNKISPEQVNMNQNQTSCSNDRSSFFRWGFDGMWEIDFWGKIWYEKKAQYYAFESRIEQMRIVYLILIAEVAQTFISLCALHNKLALQKNLIAIHDAISTLTKQLLQSGLNDALSWHETKEKQAQAQDVLANLQSQYEQMKHKLAFLLGNNPQNSLISPASMKKIPLSKVTIATGLPSDLLRRRPDIREAERLLASANALVGQSIAEWFPSFTLFTSIGHESYNPISFFSNQSLTWSIGPGIRWPLLSFGRIKAHIKTRKSQKRQAILEYSNRIINALKEVEDFLIGYFKSKESLAHSYNAYKEKARIEKLEQEKFLSGLSSQLSLLQKQKSAISAQLTLIDRKESLSSTLVSLYKALGGGW